MLKADIAFPSVHVEAEWSTTEILVGVLYIIGALHEKMALEDAAEAEAFKQDLQRCIADEEGPFWHFAEMEEMDGQAEL